MNDRTRAYLNLHAVLGCIPLLCELDVRAKHLIRGEDLSIGFEVKGGPAATLVFKDTRCSMVPGAEACTIRLPFSGPEKFNGLIDGTVTPLPSKGFTKVGFLLKKFTKITDILDEYLRPAPEALEDGRFFDISTRLMFRLIVEAVAQVGDCDVVGQASASYITDGVIRLSILDGGPSAAVKCENHVLTALHEAPEKFTSYMDFADMRTARELFDGKINAVAAVGQGTVRIGGMISQVDNINRILDRVALYMA